jgi:O-acetyl-ADP-ribose deacetylase (regulator of RNase III)
MIEIIQSDITKLTVDAIVNAANAELRGGGGVDGAIHRAAGPDLMNECRLLPGCPTGKAVKTLGYRLPAKFVIHAVGPIWRGGHHGEKDLLASAYRSVFEVAREEPGIRTIALPAISTGIYHFPKDLAATIALQAMLEAESQFERIIACLFDQESEALYGSTLGELRQKAATQHSGRRPSGPKPV